MNDSACTDMTALNTVDTLTGAYRTVRFPDGRIAFRFNPHTWIVEIQRGGQKHWFDLSELAKGLEVEVQA